jgi:hypothetical protein
LQGCREYHSLLIEFNKDTYNRKCIPNIRKNDKRIKKFLTFDYINNSTNSSINSANKDNKDNITNNNLSIEDFRNNIRIKNNNHNYHKYNNNNNNNNKKNRRLQSLYDNFNRIRGNDHAWAKSIRYLRKTFNFDFSSFVDKYIHIERENCFTTLKNITENKKRYFRSCQIKQCKDN